MTKLFLNGVLFCESLAPLPVFKWAKIAAKVGLKVRSCPGYVYFEGEKTHLGVLM